MNLLTDINQSVLEILYGPLILKGPYFSKKDHRVRCFLRLLDLNGNTLKVSVKSYPRILMESKLGRILENWETVDHIDDNPLNNNFSNLQILSLTDNVKKAHLTRATSSEYIVNYSRSLEGRTKSSERFKGESNPSSVFSNEEVIYIRMEVLSGKINRDEIIRKYGVTRRSADNLIKGITYSHLNDKTPELFESTFQENIIKSVGRASRFSTEDILDMIELRNQGKSNFEIAELYSIHYTTVSKKISNFLNS